MVRFRFCRRLLHRYSRQIVGLVLLFSFSTGMVGFPVAQRVAKDRSQPFPCQDSTCGCADAQSCWKACCCHTNAEKLAWAKKNGVAPPDYVVAAAREEEARSAPTVASCCQPKQAVAKTCCATSAKASCCASHEAKSPATKADSPRRFAMVSIDAYHRCHGIPPLWLSLGEVGRCYVEPTVIAQPLAGEWIAITSQNGEFYIAAPDVPPPRQAVI